ncbi:MAG: hypothetical protein WA797_10010 [Acidimicrobiales bacterium]
MSGRSASRVICCVPNIMDRSRISAAAPDCAFVASPEALLQRVAETQRDHPSDRVLVVVDLDRPGMIEAIEGLTGHGSWVIGFGSHVARDTLSAARAAGCRAFPRSELFRRLSEGIEHLALSDGREPPGFR